MVQRLSYAKLSAIFLWTTLCSNKLCIGGVSVCIKAIQITFRYKHSHTDTLSIRVHVHFVVDSLKMTSFELCMDLHIRA